MRALLVLCFCLAVSFRSLAADAPFRLAPANGAAVVEFHTQSELFALWAVRRFTRQVENGFAGFRLEGNVLKARFRGSPDREEPIGTIQNPTAALRAWPIFEGSEP